MSMLEMNTAASTAQLQTLFLKKITLTTKLLTTDLKKGRNIRNVHIPAQAYTCIHKLKSNKPGCYIHF